MSSQIYKQIVHSTNLTQSQNKQNNYNSKNRSQNSIVTLQKILKNLNNDTIKRYHTLQDQPIEQNVKQTFQKFKTRSTHHDTSQEANLKFVIEPEPWQNDMQQPKTKRNYKPSNVSKSFQFSLDKNSQKHIRKTQNFRSSTFVNPLNCQRERIEKEKLNQTIQQSKKFLALTFNHTDQQKARFSIEYLVHEKKHKKIQKILKRKAYCQDKTTEKQQKINQHSQFILEALKKLDLEKLIPNQGIRKKSSLSIQGNQKPNPPHQKQTCNQTNIRTSSCKKLETINESFPNFQKQYVVKCSINQLEPEFAKPDEVKKEKNNFKVCFKPRRTWIFEKKVNCQSQKNIQAVSLDKLYKLKSKTRSIESHFLKINKLNC